MPRPPLTVSRAPGGFVVSDPALARLAGIGPLPLPFTPEADPDEVLAHLRRLNPHRVVCFDSAAARPPLSPLSRGSTAQRGGGHEPEHRPQAGEGVP